MDINDQCAVRIIDSYFKLKKDVLFICDKPHMNLVKTIKVMYENNERSVNCLIIDNNENAQEAFCKCLQYNIETIVFIEPNSFSKLGIPR